jgi:hypothetical protein
MMRNSHLTGLFLFLCQIVQEEINQDGIDFCIGMSADDFPTNHLDGPDAAAA